jgi:hypothetical protein
MHREHTYSGALSFLRRRYTKELTGVDIAVVGVPYALATTNRPGARFGPAGIRAASSQLANLLPWPWGFDPTERLAIVDYGDFYFDYGVPHKLPDAITAQAEAVIEQGASMLAMGGASYPARWHGTCSSVMVEIIKVYSMGTLEQVLLRATLALLAALIIVVYVKPALGRGYAIEATTGSTPRRRMAISLCAQRPTGNRPLAAQLGVAGD